MATSPPPETQAVAVPVSVAVVPTAPSQPLPLSLLIVQHWGPPVLGLVMILAVVWVLDWCAKMVMVDKLEASTFATIVNGLVGAVVGGLVTFYFGGAKDGRRGGDLLQTKPNNNSEGKPK